MSVSKLVSDLNSISKFYWNLCEFYYGVDTGKVITSAKQHGDLSLYVFFKDILEVFLWTLVMSPFPILLILFLSLVTVLGPCQVKAK